MNEEPSAAHTINTWVAVRSLLDRVPLPMDKYQRINRDPNLTLSLPSNSKNNHRGEFSEKSQDDVWATNRFPKID